MLVFELRFETYGVAFEHLNWLLVDDAKHSKNFFRY